MKVRYLGQNNGAALDPAIDKALNMAAQLDGQQDFSEQCTIRILPGRLLVTRAILQT